MLGSESPIPAQGGGATARDPECKGNALLSPGPLDLCRLIFPSFCLFPSLSLFLSHTRKHTQLTLHPAPGWLHPPPAPLSSALKSVDLRGQQTAQLGLWLEELKVTGSGEAKVGGGG